MLSAKKMLSPRAVSTVRIDGKPISDELIHSTSRYFALYVLIFVISIILVSFDKSFSGTNGILSGISSVVTTLNNVGPGFAGVGPMLNFANYSNFSKIVLSVAMLLGRLEIFPMLILFSPSIWKKRKAKS